MALNSHGVIRVRLLGTPAIDGGGVDGRAVLRQPKRLALLAYLAARDGYVTRDTLVGLFWPGSDEDRARRALSQAIHFLRGELGRRAIATRGTTEVAAGAGVRCDVVEFDDAIRKQEWETALALYGGDFLDGVMSPRANELNQWLETERLRLQRLAVTAATALSDAAYQKEDLPAAISWQAKALGINSFDEAAHRMYIALLDEAGNAAGALAAHEAFCTRLRSQYDIEPSAETRRIVSLIRSRRPEPTEADHVGMPVVPAAAPAPPTPLVRPRSVPAAFGSASLRRWTRRVPAWLRSRRVVSVALTLMALLAFWSAARLNGSREEIGPSPFVANRVGVLYLDVNGDEHDLRYIADGITEALIGYLDQAPGLEVVPANAVQRFRAEHFSPDTINALLQAATLVSGRVAQDTAGRIRVTIQIEDAARGLLSQSFQIEPEAGDLFGIIDDVTSKVTETLSPMLADLVSSGQWRAGTTNEDAFRTLIRGATVAKVFDDRFKREDTTVAQAAFGRADSLFVLASRLDEDWAAPFVQRSNLAYDRAFIYELRGEIDQADMWLDRAVALADSAVQLEPEASALELKGRALYERFVLGTAIDFAVLDTADDALANALLLDPNRAGVWAARSGVMFAKSNFEEAAEFAEKALDRDAFLENRNEIQNRAFLSAFHAPLDNRARQMCNQISETQQGHWTAAQCVLNLMAWSKTEKPDPAKAWRVLEANLQRDPPSLAAYERPHLEMMLAAVLARAGLADSAENVIFRARAAGAQDPEMLYFEAAARMALGQPDSARGLLREYLRGNPPSRMHVAGYRWFKTPQTPLIDLTAAGR